MTTTLLNPGCDTCYYCDPCPQCGDYDEYWYLWLDDFEPSPYNSPSNVQSVANAPYVAVHYYWESSNLHTVLNNILASFIFPTTEPSVTTPTYKQYYHPTIALTGITASAIAKAAVYDIGTGVVDPSATWYAGSVTFSEFEIVSPSIINYCNGTRSGHSTLRFKAHSSGGPYTSWTSWHTIAANTNIVPCNEALTAYQSSYIIYEGSSLSTSGRVVVDFPGSVFGGWAVLHFPLALDNNLQRTTFRASIGKSPP